MTSIDKMKTLPKKDDRIDGDDDYVSFKWDVQFTLHRHVMHVRLFFFSLLLKRSSLLCLHAWKEFFFFSSFVFFFFGRSVCFSALLLIFIDVCVCAS